MAADTKTRILEAARALFNSEGFGALSAVDIATALSISPGHLYYHFKGKAELAAALLDGHLAELSECADSAESACADRDASIETMWTHVHILVEEGWEARFLYRESIAVARSGPRLPALVRAVFARQERAARTMLTKLRDSGRLSIADEVLDGLSSQVALGIAFQAVRLEFERPDTTPPRELIARAAALVMLPVAGFAA